MARAWERLLSPHDQEVYRQGGYSQRAGMGRRPALLVVDVTYDFVGDRPEPILESIKRFPNSCGDVGWQGMAQIRRLLDACRASGVPVLYTRGLDDTAPITRGAWAWKNARTLNPGEDSRSVGNQIPDLIAPAEGEVVIQKSKPSAFFGTPLASYLIGLGVDTVLVTGTTTSGCVRATVIDAFSHNFRTIVVEDCVFDRGELPHLANLFDMHAKYADVVPLKEVLRELEGLVRAPAVESALSS